MAGAPGSAHFFDFKMVQCEKTMHAAKNSCMSTGNATTMGPFGSQRFTVPSKLACMGIISGM